MQINSDRRSLGAVVLVGVMAATTLMTGCQHGAQVRQPMRAIWVTRYDYKTQQDVERIVDDCAGAGFNTILFQVRGNGTAFYDSSFEPWADELGGKDPGFDPLEVACDRAHDKDVDLHAYVNVMPAWRGTKLPSNTEQLYHKHPEWFWYDQYGNRQAMSPRFYVSLNPCLPEVREYIVDVFQEVVRKYDIDGLHLDYIRFPNEPPATPRGTDIDYPYDDRTLSLYHDATGLKPEADKAAWNKWRTEQVTKLVAEIGEMVKETKPRVVLSASVSSVPSRAKHHFQDGIGWTKEGLLDATILMNYTRPQREGPEEYGNKIKPWLEGEPKSVLVPGLWFGNQGTVEEKIARVKKEINTSREMTGNFCVFAYSNLFDSPDEVLTEQNAKLRAERATIREAMVPMLKELEEHDKPRCPIFGCK